MEEKFKPKAVNELDFILIALEYVTDPDSSSRSIAEEYGIGKTTVVNYLHHAGEYDTRLADLITTKMSIVINGQTHKKYKMKKSLRDYLNHVISKLSRRSTVPLDLSSYLWDEYITKNCNH